MKSLTKFVFRCSDSSVFHDLLKQNNVLKRVQRVIHTTYNTQRPHIKKWNTLITNVHNEGSHFLSNTSQRSLCACRGISSGPINPRKTWRRIHSDSSDPRKKVDSEEHPTEIYIHRDPQAVENTGWLMRMANENGYLAWCRNTYIASMVGATMYLQTTVPYSKDVSFLFFLLAFSHLLCGTVSYLYHLTALRQSMHLSKFTVLLQYLLAVGHVLLWAGAVAIYIGYVEEAEVEEKQDD